MAKKNGWAEVYKLVKQIPRGRVVTYGQLARILKLPGGARTVGYAMAGCPSGQGIPWHRVVGDRGMILPREPYGSKQRRLLESEGTQFAGLAVDLAAHQWQPVKGRPQQRRMRKRPNARSQKLRQA